MTFARPTDTTLGFFGFMLTHRGDTSPKDTSSGVDGDRSESGILYLSNVMPLYVFRRFLVIGISPPIFAGRSKEPFGYFQRAHVFRTVFVVMPSRNRNKN